MITLRIADSKYRCGNGRSVSHCRGNLSSNCVAAERPSHLNVEVIL
jgi:hypothetical protein